MKNYYILSNGRLMRKDNTLFIENAAGEKRPVPVEDVDSLYVYGEVDMNSRLLNFLTQKRIPLHVFNYYGYYSGSYCPREYLNSGYLLVKQVSHFTDPFMRLALAKEFVRGSAHSMLRNVAYYANRKRDGADDEDPPGELIQTSEVPCPVAKQTPGEETREPAVPTNPEIEEAVDAGETGEILDDTDSCPPWLSAEPEDRTAAPESLSGIQMTMEKLALGIEKSHAVSDLLGVEGKIRERYYRAWPLIVSEDWVFNRRVRRPPDNEVNALISFGNSVLYTVCLTEIYRTQLNPLIAYLHEPGQRRYSLALDLSEIFKPLIVDRAIFRLLNNRQLQSEHFEKDLDSCYLNDAGRRVFLSQLEERLKSTIKHRRLGRHVSYRHLIRLECYKLTRHLTGLEPYRAFRAWW